MSNITFERPFLTLAALMVPFIAMICSRFSREAFSLSLSLGAPGGAVFHPPPLSGFLGKICRIAQVAGISLLVFAAAGPVAVAPSVVWLDRGADILFVLDLSPSMAGIDMDGKSRFEAASALIRAFSANRGADAIGLAGVGNDAALFIPPTTDRNALYERLKTLKIGELGDGTALGMGLSVAALHIAGSTAARKAVVLITDGENNAGPIHPETAALVYAENNIPLYIIAAGTSGEVPIDYIDPFTNMRRTGSFDSRYNPESLAAIAAAGAGLFIPAPSADAFAGAFSRINKAEITVSRSGTREKKTPLHQSLILAGGFIICAAAIIKKLLLGAFL